MKKSVAFTCMLALLALFIFATLMHCARAQGPVPITIDSSPAKGTGFVNVNGTDYTTPQTFTTWNETDTVTLYAYSPVPGAAGTRYVFASWSASSFGSFTGQTYPYTVPSLSETVTASYQTQYQVTFAQTGLDSDAGSNTVLTVGTTHYVYSDFPVNIWVDSGTSYSWTDPISVSSTEKFVLTAGSSGSVTSSGTFSATYQKQYQTTFSQTGLDNDAGSNTVLTVGTTSYVYSDFPVSNWFNSGTSYNWAGTISVTSTERFVSLAGSNGSVTGPGPFSATYQKQYEPTFTETGLDGDAGSKPVLGVGTNNYIYSNFPINNVWFDSGTSYTWANPISVSSTEQFILTAGSNGLVTGSGPFSATYQKQYHLNVSSPFDTPTPASNWFNSGSSITESVTSPFSGGSGTQYVCTGWTGGGNVPSSGSVSSVAFTINAGSSITWNWKTQYQVTFGQAGVGSDCLGTVVTIDGVDYGVGGLPVSFWYDSGSSHSFAFQSYPTVGSTTKQYVWTSTTGGLTIAQSSSLTISAYGSVIGNYKTQYYFNVSSPYDSPSPPSGWFDSGSSITESVTSPIASSGTKYVCTGWTGTGSVPSSGSATSVPFTITAASTITWNWQASAGQETLTVVSPHDRPVPGVGQHLYNNGSSVTCSVTSPVTEGSNVWTCTGWTGTGSVSSSGIGNTVTFTITQDTTITWSWTSAPVQENLTVASAHDSPNPSVGVHSYNDGSSVTCNVSSPVDESGTFWTCTGWTGTGSVPAGGSGTSVSFNITQDSSITWNWQQSASQYTLTVSSLHDSPYPSDGTHVYNTGSSVTCNVTSPVTEGSTVWICTGWTGTGSVPSSGIDTSVTFTIYQNSSIIWNWHNGTVQQYYLTVVCQHGNPSPAVGGHLYDDGDYVNCSITSPVTESNVTYVCTGWSGSGSVPSSGSDTSVAFTISQNSTITWNWQVVQWTLTVVSTHGGPNPGVGYHVYDDGASVTCSVSSPVVEGGVSYTCTGWVGSGSVPSSGSDVSVVFSITQNSSITWNWTVTPSVQWTLTVSSGHGSPDPSVGDHLYDDGFSVVCNVSSPVVEGGVSYTCTGWTGTGSVTSNGSITFTSFTITQNSSITWNWTVTPSVQWTLTVVSAHGSPSPAVGNHLYDSGRSVACSITSPVTEAGQVWTCTGWAGSGSVKSSGSGTTVSFTLTENSSITWNWRVQPTIGSCDGTGVQKDVFNPDETIFMTGRGYGANRTYNVYVVNETTWVDGMTIPGRVQGTATSVSSDSSGNINPTVVWSKPLTPGNYDILVDFNGNGKYDAGVDALYSSKIMVTSGYSFIPEYVFGTILGLAGCFAALGAFRIYKRKR